MVHYINREREVQIQKKLNIHSSQQRFLSVIHRHIRAVSNKVWFMDHLYQIYVRSFFLKCIFLAPSSVLLTCPSEGGL